MKTNWESFEDGEDCLGLVAEIRATGLKNVGLQPYEAS